MNPMEQVAPKQTYRPEIDGLRAVAVLSVILFHFDLGLSGGFIGVDVFFVISGYLITTLIQNDLDNARPLFLEFWSRRIIRILPALMAMVIVVLFAGWFLLLPSDYVELGKSAVAQSAMVANLYFWATTGYFASPVLTMPLMHTWSLALEEQFYVLLPVALFCIRGVSAAHRQIVLVAAALVSFMIALHWIEYHPNAAFFLLPTRAWELLLGSVVSTIPRSLAPSRPLAEALCGIGLFMILCAGFLYTRETPFPGSAALVPCLGTAMVIYASSRRVTFVGQVLASPPFLLVGLISYSLYLWHWPIYVFAMYWRSEPLTVAMRLVLGCASVAVAYLSWRFLETPLRRRALWTSRKAIFGFAFAVLGLTALLGGTLVVWQGFPRRVPTKAVVFASAKADAPYFQNVDLDAARRHEFYRVGEKASGPVDVLIWGDSHAMAVEPILAEIGNTCGLRIVGAHYASTAPLLEFTSTSPFSLRDQSDEYNASILEYVRTERIPVVILSAKWKGYLGDYVTTTKEGKEKVNREFRESVLATIRALKQVGARVWILEMVPTYNYDVPRKLAADAYFGGDLSLVGKSLAQHRMEMAFESSVFREAKGLGAGLLDPTPYLCPASFCQTNRNGRSLYMDTNHLSLTGSKLLREMFEPVFRRIPGPGETLTESNCAIRTPAAGSRVP